jgi:Na+/melibiose symporter-like transporter
LSLTSGSAMLDFGKMRLNEYFHRTDYVKISIFGFALTALWGSLHTIILPIRLLGFVAPAEKNTALGMLTFTGLVLGMIIQPVSGTLSDHSSLAWGKRRPFILLGAALALIFIPGLAAFRSYAAVFAVYCLLQLSTNTAQGPYQGFIPDLVTAPRRGLASGVKSLLEILGGVVMLYPVAMFMDNFSTSQQASWLWLALGSLALVLVAATVFTMLAVRELPGRGGGWQLRPALTESFRIDNQASRGFILFLVSRLLFFLSFTALQTFTLYFLQDVVHVANPAAATARFSIVAVIGMLVAVYPAGRLSDRVGRKPIVLASGLLGAAGIALVYTFQTSFDAVMLCGGLIGLAFGAFTSTNWALATDLAAPGQAAKYLGLTNLATAGGSALSRLIGPVIDFGNGFGAGIGYSVMLAICFISFITGAVLPLHIKTPASGPKEA